MPPCHDRRHDIGETHIFCDLDAGDRLSGRCPGRCEAWPPGAGLLDVAQQVRQDGLAVSDRHARRRGAALWAGRSLSASCRLDGRTAPGCKSGLSFLRIERAPRTLAESVVGKFPLILVWRRIDGG